MAQVQALGNRSRRRRNLSLNGTPGFPPYLHNESETLTFQFSLSIGLGGNAGMARSLPRSEQTRGSKCSRKSVACS